MKRTQNLYGCTGATRKGNLVCPEGAQIYTASKLMWSHEDAGCTQIVICPFDIYLMLYINYFLLAINYDNLYFHHYLFLTCI